MSPPVVNRPSNASKLSMDSDVPPLLPARDLRRSRSTFDARPSNQDYRGNHDPELHGIKPKPRLSVRSIVDNLEVTTQMQRRNEQQAAFMSELHRRREPLVLSTGGSSVGDAIPAYIEVIDENDGRLAGLAKSPSSQSMNGPKLEMPQQDVGAYLELQDENDENVEKMVSPPLPPVQPRRPLRISVSASPTAQTRGKHVKINENHDFISGANNGNDPRRKLSNTKSAPQAAGANSAALSANSSFVSLAAMSSNLVGMASIVPSQLTMSSSSLGSSMLNFSSRLAASRVNSSALSVISSSAGVSRHTVSDDGLGEEVMAGGKRGSTELWSPMKGGPLIVARNRSGLLKDNPYHDSPLLVRQRSQRVSDPEPEVYIPPENVVVLCRRRADRWRRRHADLLGKFLYAILLGAANAYVISALWHHFNKAKSLKRLSPCDGPGLLLTVMAIFYGAVFYAFVIKKLAVPFITDKTRHWNPCLERVARVIDNEYAKAAFDTLVCSAFVVAFVADAKNSPDRLRAGVGLSAFLGLGFLISKRPSKIRWKFIFRGIIFQVIITYIILNTTALTDMAECVHSKTNGLLLFSRAGTTRAYGFLSSGSLDVKNIQAPSPITNTSRLAAVNRMLTKNPLKVATESVLAFQAISVLFFASFVIEALYYFGTIPWMVEQFGSVLGSIFGTTPVEMASAFAHVFMPNTIVAVSMHKYLSTMTRSQLHLMLSCGFAGSSGLLNVWDAATTPSKLISSSLMSIPAAITMSKLIHPEFNVRSVRAVRREVSRCSEAGADTSNQQLEPSSFLDAVTNGSYKAIDLVMTVIANVICVVALVAFLGVFVRFFGSALGFQNASLQDLFASVLLPIAWATGVAYGDYWATAQLLARRLVLVQANDHVSNLLLSSLDDRSARIASFMLAGSGRFVTMGLQLGSWMALAMDRRKDVAELIVRAFITGYLATLVTGAICGMLLHPS